MRTFEYQPERGRFRDWLRTVTRHELARQQGRQQPGTLGVGGETGQTELDRVEAQASDSEWTAAFNAQVLSVALERVRPLFAAPLWQAFEGIWLEHRPAREVARELGLGVDKVYVAKSRVLRRLREEVLMLAEDVPHALS